MYTVSCATSSLLSAPGALQRLSICFLRTITDDLVSFSSSSSTASSLRINARFSRNKLCIVDSSLPVLMSVRTESSPPPPDRAEERAVDAPATPERLVATARAEAEGPRALWRSDTVPRAGARADSRADSRADPRRVLRAVLTWGEAAAKLRADTTREEIADIPPEAALVSAGLRKGRRSALRQLWVVFTVNIPLSRLPLGLKVTHSFIAIVFGFAPTKVETSYEWFMAMFFSFSMKPRYA